MKNKILIGIVFSFSFIGSLFFLDSTALAGDGLFGSYPNGNTQIDADINFCSPAGNCPGGTRAYPFSLSGSTNSFDVTWTGYIVPQYSQTYTFYISRDDDAAVWVNNTQIISKGRGSSVGEEQGSIALTANTYYPIRIEFSQTACCVARTVLYWSSASQPKVVVPQSALFSTGAAVITSLSPNTKNPGDAGFTLTVNGSGFNSSSVVQWSGSNRTTTYVSGTQLTASITAADVASAGNYNVTVQNTTPNNTTSSPMVFTVNYPSPTISSISPATYVATASTITLTVNGTGFGAGSVINVDGSGRTTTFVSSTQLTTSFYDSTAGTRSITVTNPTPCTSPCTSSGQTLTVTTAPTITSINPANGPALEYVNFSTISGSGFVAGGPSWSTYFCPFGGGSCSYLNQPFTVTDNAITGGQAYFGDAGRWNFRYQNPDGSVAQCSDCFRTYMPPTQPCSSGCTVEPTSTSPSWVAKTSMPTASARYALTTSTVNRKIYAIGGLNDSGSLNLVEEYDPAANSWTAKASMPTARYGLDSAVIGNKIYVIGGYSNSSGQYFNKNEVYSPATDTWTTKAFMPTARGFLNTSVVDGKIYAIGGYNGSILSVNEEYDPSVGTNGKWTAKLAMPTARYALAGAVLKTGTSVGSQIHLVGGIAGSGVSATNELYQPSDDTWGSRASMPVARYGLSATNLNNQVYAVGGLSAETDSTILNDNMFYDRQLNSWTSQVDMPSARYGLDVSSYDNKMYAIGGYAGGYKSSNEAYTPPVTTPVLTQIYPSSVTAGTTSQLLKIYGEFFVPQSVVNYNGSARTTTYVSSTEVTIQLAAADMSTTGNRTVTVTNPSPGGVSTNSLTFTVLASNPAPTISSLSPERATVGTTGPFMLTVNGSNFVAQSRVVFDGSTSRPTTFISSSALSIELSTADLATEATRTVSVSTPTPGGGSTATKNFYIDFNDSWVSKAPIPTGRYCLGTTTLNNKIHAIGGLIESSGSYSYVKTHEVYDPASNSWTAKPDMPTGRACPAVHAASGKVYAIGGLTNQPYPDGYIIANEAYDLASETWSSKTSMPSNNRRILFGSAEANNKIYILGGYRYEGAGSTSLILDSNEVYDPSTNSWSVKAVMPTVRAYFDAASISNKIHVFGGIESNAVPAPYSNFVYNPADDSWTAKADMPTPLWLAATGAVNSKAFAIGGYDYYGGILPSDLNEEYDPSSDTWAFRNPMPTPRWFADAAAYNNKLYVISGLAGSGSCPCPSSTANEEYSPLYVTPVVTKLDPSSIPAGASSFTLKIKGRYFVSQSVVNFNNSPRTTTFVSGNELRIQVSSSDVALVGSYPVTVTNPGSAGTSDPPLMFQALAQNPAPTLSSLSPSSVASGTAGPLTLTLNGSGFVSQSTVNFNGSPRATELISSTQVSIELSSEDMATGGSYTVNVSTTGPGGGTSTTRTFDVNNPVPTAASINPTSIVGNSGISTLTVNGTNFVPGSIIKYDGANRATTYISTTAVSMQITGADSTNIGNHTVEVLNPTPGGGTTSPALTFTVTNPAPNLASLSPAVGTVGSSSFTLTVNGTCTTPAPYTSQSIIKWGSTSKTTTYVNACQLTAPITASEVSAPGSVVITVFNPTPGGGTSSGITLPINYALPTTTSLSPTAMNVGTTGPQTLAVNGSGFTAQSVVKYDGVNRTTTFVSNTQVSIQLATADLATTGTHTISVTNPTPGGGTSGDLIFSVVNPAPAASSLNPSSKILGDAGFTLTFDGSNFVPGIKVRFNGSDRTTTFVSSTRVTASIPASDLTTAGTFNIAVLNPAPGGGLSGTLTFTVNNPMPAISSISPTSKPLGSTEFTLTVNGSNFIPSSKVRFDGAERATTFVSATKLTAVIPTTDLVFTGDHLITVVTPTPGGGTSNTHIFTITALPTSQFSIALNPSAATVSKAQYVGAGSPLTAVIEGSSSLTSGVAITGSPVIVLYEDPLISRADGQSVGGPTKIFARVNPGGCTQEGQVIVDPRAQGCLSVFLVNPDASASGVTYYIDVKAVNEQQRPATARFTLTVKP